MVVTSIEFFKEMLKFLPTTLDSYEESVNRFGEVLETVIIEDIFMPEVIKLLKAEDNMMLLNCIFGYFEEVCNRGDDHLINIFSITVLEMLGDDKDILYVAQKYMRQKTKQLLIQTIQSM